MISHGRCRSCNGVSSLSKRPHCRTLQSTRIRRMMGHGFFLFEFLRGGVVSFGGKLCHYRSTQGLDASYYSYTPKYIVTRTRILIGSDIRQHLMVLHCQCARYRSSSRPFLHSIFRNRFQLNTATKKVFR